MSDANRDSDAANVVPLPVAPVRGLDAETVRVPKALLRLVALLYPNTSFDNAVVLMAHEVDDLRRASQTHQLTAAENANLKRSLSEFLLRHWVEQYAGGGPGEQSRG